jgi:NAD(P)-dependent dehydrogenase (short-subunit alcohol dehydrogenase family)
MKERFSYKPENIFSLSDEVVLVTGAAGQLGSSTVNGLIDNNAKVIATDTNLESLKQSSHRSGWNKDSVILAECNITRREDIISVIEKCSSITGPVTALVSNAGVSVFEPYLERTEESIDWVMDVNIKGTLLCIQEFIKHRKENDGGGCIVNIGSHYGVVSPDPRIYTDCDRKNSEIYGATKAGILQMTRYFAVHAAEYNIRTNAVSPGGIRNLDNPQGDDFQKNYSYRCPMGRMAETHEMIGAILFLLSPGASYINGHNIVVDGGTTSL